MSQVQQSGRESEYSLTLPLFTPSRRYPITLESTICYTQSTDSNTNLISNIPTEKQIINVQPNIWASHGAAKLTHKINYYNNFHHLQAQKTGIFTRLLFHIHLPPLTPSPLHTNQFTKRYNQYFPYDSQIQLHFLIILSTVLGTNLLTL